MICLRCDNQEFVPKQDAVIEQEFKGEVFQVQAPALACSKCGWITLDAETTDELRRRTADAYRKKHGLLTSDEIRALRQLLDMNQKEFAAFVGVGEASVKRWETWLVQERSSDQLIRLTCEKALRELLPQNQPASVWVPFEISFTHVGNWFTIQTEPVKTAIPLRCAVGPELPEPKEEPQMQLCDLAGTDNSPPDTCAARAFSFSMLSPEQFQTEGVEKENATRIENLETNWRITNHDTPAPALTFAA